MFKDNLIRIRKQRGLTQQQLADKLACSRSTIGMYENGSREPSFETAEYIADVLNCRLDDLIGKKEAPTAVDALQKEIISLFNQLTAQEKLLAIKQIQAILDSHQQ